MTTNKMIVISFGVGAAVTTTVLEVSFHFAGIGDTMTRVGAAVVSIAAFIAGGAWVKFVIGYIKPSD